MLWNLTDDEIQQLGNDRRQDDANQKSFDLVPNPGTQPLIGELEAVFEAESIEVEPQAKQFAHHHQHQQVQKHCQRVVLKCRPIGEVAQGTAPSRLQQHDKQNQAENKIGNFQPSPDAVVTPCLGRIGRDGGGGSRRAHLQQY